MRSGSLGNSTNNIQPVQSVQPTGEVKAKTSDSIGGQDLKSSGLQKLGEQFNMTESKTSSPSKYNGLDAMDDIMGMLENDHVEYTQSEDNHVDVPLDSFEVKSNVDDNFNLLEQVISSTDGNVQTKSDFEVTHQTVAREELKKLEPELKPSLKDVKVATTNVEKQNAPQDEGAKVVKEKVGGLKGLFSAIKSFFTQFTDSLKSRLGIADFNAVSQSSIKKEVKAEAVWCEPPGAVKRGEQFQVNDNMSLQEKARILDQRDNAIASKITFNDNISLASKQHASFEKDGPATISRRLGHGLAEIERGINQGSGDKQGLMTDLANRFSKQLTAISLESFPVDRLTNFANQLRSEGRTDKAELLDKIILAVAERRNPDTIYENNIGNAKAIVTEWKELGTFLRETGSDGAIAMKTIMNSYCREFTTSLQSDLDDLSANYGFRTLDKSLEKEKVKQATQDMSPKLAGQVLAGCSKLVDIMTDRTLPDDAIKFLKDMTKEINNRNDITPEEKSGFVKKLYVDQIFLKILNPSATVSSFSGLGPKSLNICSQVLQKIANAGDKTLDNPAKGNLGVELEKNSASILSKINDFMIKCGMPEDAM